MPTEYLEVNGDLVPHLVTEVDGDGSCMFRALSVVMYGTERPAMQVRRRIVRYVARNWERFKGFTLDPDTSDNYSNVAAYVNDMSKPTSYGTSAELQAAAEIFNFCFEVYRDGNLFWRFGKNTAEVKRLRFTGDLSFGHFDAYSYESDESD